MNENEVKKLLQEKIDEYLSLLTKEKSAKSPEGFSKTIKKEIDGLLTNFFGASPEDIEALTPGHNLYSGSGKSATLAKGWSLPRDILKRIIDKPFNYDAEPKKIAADAAAPKEPTLQSRIVEQKQLEARKKELEAKVAAATPEAKPRLAAQLEETEGKIGNLAFKNQIERDSEKYVESKRRAYENEKKTRALDKEFKKDLKDDEEQDAATAVRYKALKDIVNETQKPFQAPGQTLADQDPLQGQMESELLGRQPPKQEDIEALEAKASALSKPSDFEMGSLDDAEQYGKEYAGGVTREDIDKYMTPYKARLGEIQKNMLRDLKENKLEPLRNAFAIKGGFNSTEREKVEERLQRDYLEKTADIEARMMENAEENAFDKAMRNKETSKEGARFHADLADKYRVQRMAEREAYKNEANDLRGRQFQYTLAKGAIADQRKAQHQEKLNEQNRLKELEKGHNLGMAEKLLGHAAGFPSAAPMSYNPTAPTYNAHAMNAQLPGAMPAQAVRPALATQLASMGMGLQAAADTHRMKNAYINGLQNNPNTPLPPQEHKAGGRVYLNSGGIADRLMRDKYQEAMQAKANMLPGAQAQASFTGDPNAWRGASKALLDPNTSGFEKLGNAINSYSEGMAQDNTSRQQGGANVAAIKEAIANTHKTLAEYDDKHNVEREKLDIMREKLRQQGSGKGGSFASKYDEKAIESGFKAIPAQLEVMKTATELQKVLKEIEPGWLTGTAYGVFKPAASLTGGQLKTLQHFETLANKLAMDEAKSMGGGGRGTTAAMVKLVQQTKLNLSQGKDVNLALLDNIFNKAAGAANKTLKLGGEYIPNSKDYTENKTQFDSLLDQFSSGSEGNAHAEEKAQESRPASASAQQIPNEELAKIASQLMIFEQNGDDAAGAKLYQQIPPEARAKVRALMDSQKQQPQVHPQAPTTAPAPGQMMQQPQAAQPQQVMQ